jgi:nucleoside-diphosphate-sugar epimerase
MKVLITGGAGFLGINLIRYLLQKGYEIISLDIADFNYPDVQNDVEIVKGDIRDKELVGKITPKVDMVVHSAMALPLYPKEEILTTGIEGTRTLLEATLKNNISRFVFISSTAVYGIPNHHPIYEKDELIGVGPYGKAKIEAEKMCRNFRENDLIVPILRPKSFIGPERLGVFALLYDWAYTGHNFPMIGNGKNRYQLLDVEDLCESIEKSLTLPEENVNRTFNIGAKEFTTMRDDYQAVLDYAGYGKKIIGLPKTPAILTLKLLELFNLSPLYKWVYETAGKDSFVSIEKAEKYLGYSPKYSNKDALIRNFKWYVENLENFTNSSGVSHRVPWNQGILKLAKQIF